MIIAQSLRHIRKPGVVRATGNDEQWIQHRRRLQLPAITMVQTAASKLKQPDGNARKRRDCAAFGVLRVIRTGTQCTHAGRRYRKQRQTAVPPMFWSLMRAMGIKQPH